MPEKTVWIIAGESSGDGYGASLADALRRCDPHLRILGMGCGKMRAAGVQLQVDSTELDVVGFVEILKRLPFFLRLIRRLSAEIISSHPQAVVLIDYPGFNLRLAKRLHAAGIRVFWYISPQVWAWKKGRIPKLAACVDRMMCIFPFEPAVYAGSGLPAEFVGHPLLEILAPFRKKNLQRDANCVAILPGSRSSELKYLLRTFLLTARELKRQRPELHFHLPLQREKSRHLAEKILEKMKVCGELPDDFASSLEITVGDAREVMCKCAAGLAASGTVTVEAAILGLPLVVSYRVNWLTWLLAKCLVHLKYISIANLVLGRMVYEEKLQGESIPSSLVPAMLRILPGGERAEEVRRGLAEFVEKLGREQPVSDIVAKIVLEENLGGPAAAVSGTKKEM